MGMRDNIIDHMSARKTYIRPNTAKTYNSYNAYIFNKPTSS